MMTPTRRSIRRATSLLFVLLFTTASLAQILSVSPAQNALNVPPNTGIAVTFNQDMLAATIKDTTFLAWGMHSGWHHGTITYDKALRRATLTPKTPFAPGEMVAVTLTGDILTSAGQPLQKFAWHFTIRVTPSSGKFPINTDYGIGSTPVALFAADFDGDRDMDFREASSPSVWWPPTPTATTIWIWLFESAQQQNCHFDESRFAPHQPLRL